MPMVWLPFVYNVQLSIQSIILVQYSTRRGPITRTPVSMLPVCYKADQINRLGFLPCAGFALSSTLDQSIVCHQLSANAFFPPTPPAPTP